MGPNPSRDAESGDLVVALTRTSAQAGAPMSAEDLVPIPQGQSFLAGLRGALKDKFQVCGNHHWGTVTDCAAISDSLDVGVLIFADKLQQRGTQCLVNVDAIRGDFTYFVALWWDEPIHFRLAQYKADASSTYRSFWRASELPPALREHYNKCNPAAPVGRARRLGIS